MKKRRLYTRVAEALLGAFDGAELGWRYGSAVALVSPDAHFENDSDTATATGGQTSSLVGGKGAGGARKGLDRQDRSDNTGRPE
jgi:hypothetical protein